MNLITIYRVFKNEDGSIWKVDPLLVPENKVKYWKEMQDCLTRQELEDKNINIIN